MNWGLDFELRPRKPGASETASSPPRIAASASVFMLPGFFVQAAPLSSIFFLFLSA